MLMKDKTPKPYLICVDHTVSKKRFNLILDKKKELLITKPKPSKEELPGYYESADYISHTDTKKGFVDKLYQIVKRYTLTKKVNLIDSLELENRTLLDIGAGTGDFLNKAKLRGWKVEGIEPNLKAQQKAISKGIQIKTNYDQLVRNEFSVITMWHVLEHVYDLEKQIEIIEQYLNENGTLIVAVPNYKSFDALYYKNFWAAFDVPRHLWHFSKTSITQLFEPRGFVVHTIIPMYYDSFYVSLLSEKYRKGKFQILNAFRIGLLSNVKAKFLTKEYSSLIFFQRPYSRCLSFF